MRQEFFSSSKAQESSKISISLQFQREKKLGDTTITILPTSIVKISATHDSKEQFGYPAYLKYYAIRHELKNHYYSNHPEILPVTQQQRQCQTSNSDDSIAQEQ